MTRIHFQSFPIAQLTESTESKATALKQPTSGTRAEQHRAKHLSTGLGQQPRSITLTPQPGQSVRIPQRGGWHTQVDRQQVLGQREAALPLLSPTSVRSPYSPAPPAASPQALTVSAARAFLSSPHNPETLSASHSFTLHKQRTAIPPTAPTATPVPTTTG